ncbi:hypothetical protein C7T94_04630 [Pedobacter yulinensis]|uniref:DUF4476 domain-containing protein n=1 Tax=Pedobacter yulinensis TaxID=2126353 RepID=A0A2T3HNP2_9SPHI|nr:DUF4476 domain-containing protein [Pedobacter yulinensis]PST84027.1 hypothetical protein C7T94_04630 [Pedobacter yulinensis]
MTARSFAALLSLMLLSVFASAQGRGSTSELFIEIKEPGVFTVIVDDERISSAKGRFRFFETASQVSLTVMRRDMPVLHRSLAIPRGTRMVATLLPDGQFLTEKQLYIFKNNRYVLDNWDGYTESGPLDPARPGRPGRGRGMSADDLELLTRSMANSGFDEDKRKVAEASLKNAWLSTSQLAQVLKTFSFSAERLKLIKFAYLRLTDPQNAHSLTSFLNFADERESLLNFLRTAPDENR